MASNAKVHTKIRTILEDLKQELEKVVHSDDRVSTNERKLIDFVDSRISPLKVQLNHVLIDNEVTVDEKNERYGNLNAVLNDSIALARDEDRIDEEEIF